MSQRDAVVERFISKDRNVLLAKADFGRLFRAYLEHSRAWVGDPDGLILIMMRQALAAAALYLTCRPTDENTAWTINFPEPPLNIFVTCDASAGRVVGRYYTDHVKAEPETRLIVQAVRRTGEPQLSILAVTGFDILSIFEQYYTQSEQLTVRFFELEEDRFYMVMALPDIDEAWLHDLTRDEVLALLEEETTQKIEERPVQFACGCSAERLAVVTGKMFAGRLDELFGDDAQLEAHCPQCGRAYELTRAQLEAQAAPGAGQGPETAAGETSAGETGTHKKAQPPGDEPQDGVV